LRLAALRTLRRIISRKAAFALPVLLLAAGWRSFLVSAADKG
jgi:hypothetical protein